MSPSARPRARSIRSRNPIAENIPRYTSDTLAIWYSSSVSLVLPARDSSETLTRDRIEGLEHSDTYAFAGAGYCDMGEAREGDSCGYRLR